MLNIPDEAKELLKEAEPDMSIASWAIRFAAFLPDVAMVLSGMSNMEQMEDNLSYMSSFKPLTENEKQLIEKVTKIIVSKENIACTDCRYCVDGCPKKIAISDYFKLMNDISKFGEPQIARAKQYKMWQVRGTLPQHLTIRKYLDDTAAMLE